jgi:hypothetical protein
MTLKSQHFLLSLDNSLQKPSIVKADGLSGKTQMLCMLAAIIALQRYKVCIVFSCKHLAFLPQVDCKTKTNAIIELFLLLFSQCDLNGYCHSTDHAQT